MNDNTIKFLTGLGFGLTIIGFTIWPLPHSEEIVNFCWVGLGGVTGYHLKSTRGAPGAGTFPDSTN